MIDLSGYAKKLNGKALAVFGLGISGVSVIRALRHFDISVIAWDDKQENRDKAQALGAEILDITSADLSDYAALILAPGVPYTFNPHPVVINAQKYELDIIGDLELLSFANHGLKTIGITGTNGKSTTTALMTHVFNSCDMPAVMGGNIGKPVFDLDLPSGYQALILEISSYQMDLCPTFRPDISVLLNMSADHLDRHGSMEEYIKAKARILNGKGESVIAVDDDFTQKLFNETFCKEERQVTPVAVQAEIIEGYYVRDGILFQNAKGKDIEIGDLNGLETLKGMHNHENILCVYATALKCGLDSTQVLEALKTYGGLAHRQYLVKKSNNVDYINDSKATNAEATAKALSSYDNIYWIIGGLAKEGGLRGLSEFESKIKKTYLIGEAQDDFAQWLDKYGMPYEKCDVLDVATEKAHIDAQKSGTPATVLLSPACASWDQFSSFEKRGDAFMEKVEKLTGENS